MHHRILNTIYKRLTGQTKAVAQIGSHWQQIGFQRSDPRTDIRGSGMLGVLQFLFILEEFPETIAQIF